MRISAGDLRWRVAFDRHASMPDGYGNTQVGFEEQFIVWAKVQVRLGNEAMIAGYLQDRQPVMITVRQSALTRTVTENWRARDVRSGAHYAIRSIADPDGKGEWLDILALTGVPA